MMKRIILKDCIKTKIIKNNYLLKGMNCFYRLKSGEYFRKQVAQRYYSNLFDYKFIASPLPYYPIEPVIENNYYGLGRTLIKYAKLSGSTNSYIEHGIFFGPNIVPWERDWKVKNIIVPSLVREQHLRMKGITKNVMVVGPYIHYVKSLLNAFEYDSIKKTLGKTLLVFPTHSIMNVAVEYDIEHFISFIESVRSNYKTILICLYWLDALDIQTVEMYRKHGFKIVTAGNRFDPHFLSRLKSIISLADDTISNDVGTHIGYCIYLNKSHYIFAQPVSYRAKDVIEEIRLKNSYNEDGKDAELYENEINEVKTTFSTFTPGKISEAQWHIVDKYWGIGEIKSPQKLREAFI